MDQVPFVIISRFKPCQQASSIHKVTAPVSVSRIPKNPDYPFEMMHEGPHGDWTYLVTPIGAWQWR
jgi:hypothetical protein